MTLLNSSSGYPDPSYFRKTTRSLARGLFGVVNSWVATIIARREQQATLTVLRRLSDRDLRDMGIYRGQIGEALGEAARHRASRQHPNP